MIDLETPPAEPIDWFVVRSDGRATIVKARTWYEARDAGARSLGVDRYAVNCRKSETSAETETA